MAKAKMSPVPKLADILFERSVDGLCLVAPDGAVVRANAEWLRSTGFSEEQVVGENLIDLFPSTRDIALAIHAGARAGHRVELPRHARVIDGRKTWWEGSIEPVQMEGGTGLLITARVTDAHALRRARELEDLNAQLRAAKAKLAGRGRASEARHRLALEAAGFGTFEFIPATGELRWDRQMKRQWGLPPADDLDYPRAMERIHPEDLPRVERVVQESLDPSSTGEYLVEYRLAWPDGSLHWIHARGKVEFEGVASERRAVKLIGVEVDVTDRKRAEEALRREEKRFRSVFENMAEGLVVFDQAGHIIYQNPASERIHSRRLTGERTKLEHLVVSWRVRNYPDGSLVRPEDWAIPRVLRGECVRNERFFVDCVEDPARSFVGTYNGAPVYDAEGKLDYGFLTIEEITEQAAAESALRVANERLREADGRKDEFLSMLSHELRNPLAPIRNSTYILQHATPGSEQAQRAQAVIQRQTEHLTRLVDDLLDVTRIVRGKVALRRARADLREVVGHAADDFRWTMQDRGISFEVVAPDEPVWAEADATRISQVVGNLLHNAAKFSGRGDSVKLSMAVFDAGVEIRVRDTGSGIDAALLPRIFEAFVQGERTLARTEGGLGVGLALVKGIAELHGGTVRAESAGQGLGAEFIVRLPVVSSAGAARVADAHRRASNGGRRVLVVDDNHDAAESLADLVRMLGHAVEVAYDGPSAIESVRANPPTVVLCDLGLPGMSGYDVAKALRTAALDNVQLIAVSGYAQPEDVKRAIDAGFHAHIAKPCDPEKIERILG